MCSSKSVVRAITMDDELSFYWRIFNWILDFRTEFSFCADLNGRCYRNQVFAEVRAWRSIEQTNEMTSSCWTCQNCFLKNLLRLSSKKCTFLECLFYSLATCDNVKLCIVLCCLEIRIWAGSALFHFFRSQNFHCLCSLFHLCDVFDCESFD